jgi:hypothetical protein
MSAQNGNMQRKDKIRPLVVEVIRVCELLEDEKGTHVKAQVEVKKMA